MMKRIVIALVLLTLVGCKTSDQEISVDIAGKAKEDLNFAGLHYTVSNGVVYFTGRCPSDKAFAKIKQTISNIHVIKSVRYNVEIAPVTLDSLTTDRQRADSITAPYPQVVAGVNAAGITLKGVIDAGKKSKLVEALHKQLHKPVMDSLTSR